jgi:hypothetical protein
MVVALLTGCSKSPATNFSCLINGATFTGSGVTTINTTASTPTFNVVMIGVNYVTVTLTWYNIDSAGAERTIVPKTYPIPVYQLPPFTVSASVVNASGVTYSTTNTSGSITVTSNTGPGGVISGTFSFDAINPNNSSDSIVITQGIFTKVPVISS